MISNIERKAIRLAIRSMSEYDKERALEVAIILHDFIVSNAGETADWPLQICSPDKEIIEEFSILIREFKKIIANS